MSIQTPTAIKTKPKFINLDSAMSVEEWASLPDTKPRYELIDGILVRKMTTKLNHAITAGNFLFRCMLWAESSGWRFIPEGFGVQITEYTAYVPDVVGFAPGTEAALDQSYGSAPFLVAEVLSPRTVNKDRTTKMRGYAGAGVQIYVLIDPDARIMEIYRNQNGVYGVPELLNSEGVWKPQELPGLELQVADLWK